jgi:predicted nuclease with RNAse H fold
MRTLGIDLASDPKNTAYCVLEWAGGTAEVWQLCVGEEGGPLADDDHLLELRGQADVTGIDCPFGWPTGFVAFLCSISRPTDEPLPAWSEQYRDELKFRTTDRWIRDQLNISPLSVSADRIAIPAFRCQGLLTRMGVTDRSGDGRVYEVYPAAALKQWGFQSTGYKKAKGRTLRGELVDQLMTRTAWLRHSEQQRERMLESDDALDALVASLNARAAKVGLTIKPEADEHRAAVREGWIAIPEKGSLEKLATAG